MPLRRRHRAPRTTARCVSRSRTAASRTRSIAPTHRRLEAGRSDQAAVEGDQPQDTGRQTLSGAAAQARKRRSRSTTRLRNLRQTVRPRQARYPLLRHRLLPGSGRAFRGGNGPDPDAGSGDSGSNSPAEPISGEAALTLVRDNAGPNANAKAQGPVMPGEVDPCGRDAVAAGLSEDDVADVAGCGEPNDSEGRQARKRISPCRKKRRQRSKRWPRSSLESTVPQARCRIEGTCRDTGRKDCAGRRGTPPFRPSPESKLAGPRLRFRMTALTAAPGMSVANPKVAPLSRTHPRRKTACPPTPWPAAHLAVRGTSTEPTFQSYTDGLSPGSQIARSVTAEIADTDRTSLEHGRRAQGAAHRAQASEPWQRQRPHVSQGRRDQSAHGNVAA